MKIDLQIQTTFSDGHNSPKEIIELAKKNNIQALAITDHDSIDGISEAQQAAKGSGIQVIPGIEMSTTLRGNRLHILGYNIDVNNKNLLGALEAINAQMKAHFIALIPEINQRLAKIKKPLLDVKAYKDLPKPYYRMPGLAQFMKEQGAVAKLEDAFPLIVDLTKLELNQSPEDAIDIIHAAGGKAVLSHPFAPRISLVYMTSNNDEQDDIIKSFVDAGLDGLECFTPCHSKEQQKRVAALALRHKLGVTAGSDWHGFLEQTGQFILNYIPYYFKDFSGVELPDEVAQNILAWVSEVK